ncbi:MAG TPA: 30S ribosomal protein S18 [Anaerolineales bacterium]|nr:30S ribosomal protein S18 [Anaerolineales bacterium]
MSNQRTSSSGGGQRGGRGRRGYAGRRSYYSRPRTCTFCDDKSQKIDYKNHELLRRFIHEDGKIRPRRQTGTCAKHQRKLASAIKRSRHLALLPFTDEVLR